MITCLTTEAMTLHTEGGTQSNCSSVWLCLIKDDRWSIFKLKYVIMKLIVLTTITINDWLPLFNGRNNVSVLKSLTTLPNVVACWTPLQQSDQGQRQDLTIQHTPTTLSRLTRNQKEVSYIYFSNYLDCFLDFSYLIYPVKCYISWHKGLISVSKPLPLC